MAGWQVTEQAIIAMNDMSAHLDELASRIHQESENMKSVFIENQDGLGAHSTDISELLDRVEVAEQSGSKQSAFSCKASRSSRSFSVSCESCSI